MPELPEVEILVRHLRPQLQGKRIRGLQVLKPNLLDRISEEELAGLMEGLVIRDIGRRGKFILFETNGPRMVSHPGMTGRMYLQSAGTDLPRHTAVTWIAGRMRFIFEDARSFGSIGISDASLQRMGPEALGETFTPDLLHQSLKGSRTPIKNRLMDQSIVAGLGNIYVSEALFRSGIRPTLASNKVSRARAQRLWSTIRETLGDAIELGVSLSLDFSGTSGRNDGLFYFGSGGRKEDNAEERFLVYGREGKPCRQCGTVVRKVVQSNRSSFYCPVCQK